MNNKKINHIKLIYEGPSVEEGQMDISDLGSALLGFKDSYARMHRLANIKDKYTLSVKGLERGSFGIEIISVSIPITLLLSGAFTLSIGLQINQVIDIIKFFKGDKPQKVKLEENIFEATNKEGEKMRIKMSNPHVFLKAITDPKLLKSFWGFIKPVGKENTDCLKYKVRDQSGKSGESVISANEKPYFEYRPPKEVITKQRKTLIAHIRAWDKQTNMGKVIYQGKPFVASFEMLNPERYHQYFPFEKPLELECDLEMNESLETKRILIYDIRPTQRDLPNI